MVSRDIGGRKKTRCPECLAPIWLKEDSDLWDPITCPECHTALEITNLDPLTVDYMQSDDDEDEDDDDWGWDEDEDDEE